MAAPIVYDWKALHKEYALSGMNRLDFATLKGIPYTNLSRQLHKIDVELEARYREQTKIALLQGAPGAAQGLVDASNNTNDPALQQRAQIAILDRIGFTPQAASINVMNVNAGQAVIAPMFANPELAEDFKAMLAGTQETDADA